MRLLKAPIFCFSLLLVSTVVAESRRQEAASVCIVDHVEQPGTSFALAELEEIIQEQGYRLTSTDANADAVIEVSVGGGSLGEEEYIIRTKEGGRIQILGGDHIGAMYGVMDVCEQLSFSVGLEGIEEVEQKPFIAKRGIKMNIALDARLPSYDDTGDAAQKNIPEMWNMGFWREYLDELARNRYNVLSLWTKHPFPALIKLEEYPDASLDDVYSFAGEITPELHKDWGTVDLFDPANLKLEKRMGIDEKIAFWQDVMQYGHDRGIEFFFFTWNIFFAQADKIYGFTPESDEALQYMRKCVRELAATYPHLTAIGVTAGEKMGMTVGDYTNVQWLWETYGKGVASVIEENPDREFRFIFRRHHTFLKDINADFTPHFPGKVETSFKYALAHLYTTAAPPLFETDYHRFVKEYGYQCWMNLRNDDIFNFRWGDPDFVREFLRKMATYPTPGFYIGSDGYLWGREFTSKAPSLSGQLEVKKHWYREMLWGRLAYDPQLGAEYFEKRIRRKFPSANVKGLYSAWQEASRIIPLVTNFHWQPIDSMWAVEGCLDHYGFQSVRRFIDCHTFDKARLIDIPAYVDKRLKNEAIERETPLDVADLLEGYSAKALDLLDRLRDRNPSPSDELNATLTDIHSMAELGNYYADKIRGATYLHLYECLDENPEKESFKTRSVESLRAAAEHWRAYAGLADGQYKTQLLARTRVLDWKAFQVDVDSDVKIARSSTGREPLLAKLFYGSGMKVPKPQKQALMDVLKDAGYEVKVIPWWEFEGNAGVGLRIFTSRIGDVSFQLFENAEGKLPEDFEENGWGVGTSHAGALWFVGKDNVFTETAFDYLIDRMKKEIQTTVERTSTK